METLGENIEKLPNLDLKKIGEENSGSINNGHIQKNENVNGPFARSRKSYAFNI